MNKRLRERAIRLLEEEQGVEFNPELLEKLNTLAASERGNVVAGLPPADRKAVYEFIWEAKGLFIGEVVRDKMSSSVLLDAMLMLTLEVGYLWGKESKDVRQ